MSRCLAPTANPPSPARVPPRSPPPSSCAQHALERGHLAPQLVELGALSLALQALRTGREERIASLALEQPSSDPARTDLRPAPSRRSPLKKRSKNRQHLDRVLATLS